MKHFFRPTLATIITTVIVTLAAGGGLYYAILCALDAAGECFQLPIALQLLIIFFMWPWVALVRFFGEASIPLASILGFAFSAIWVYFLSCAVHLAVENMWKKRG